MFGMKAVPNAESVRYISSAVVSGSDTFRENKTVHTSAVQHKLTTREPLHRP
jgi:hypothetical protein